MQVLAVNCVRRRNLAIHVVIFLYFMFKYQNYLYLITCCTTQKTQYVWLGDLILYEIYRFKVSIFIGNILEVWVGLDLRWRTLYAKGRCIKVVHAYYLFIAPSYHTYDLLRFWWTVNIWAIKFPLFYMAVIIRFLNASIKTSSRAQKLCRNLYIESE